MAAECNKKRKRGKNWSSQETVLLIEAKMAVGRDGSSAAAKWQAVAEHLESQGVVRDVEQCRSKWENMLGDYRCISEHERRAAAAASASGAAPAASYFGLSKEQRKDLKLPAKFPQEMYQLLSSAGRSDVEMDVPVVNSAAPFVSGDSFSKSSEEVPDSAAAPLHFREVGSSGATNVVVPAAGAGVATAAASAGKRKGRPAGSELSLESVAKAISESHDRILAFLQEKEENRIKMEERRMLLEQQRMDADKEHQLKLLEVLNSIATSWQKLKEETRSSPSSGREEV